MLKKEEEAEQENNNHQQNANNNNTNSENSTSSKKPVATTTIRTRRRRDPRWYEPTATSNTEALLYFAVAIATHLVFGLVSLVNTDLVDVNSIGSDLQIHSSERGCGVSLSIQAVMVLIAGAAACWLTVKVEKFPSSWMKFPTPNSTIAVAQNQNNEPTTVNSSSVARASVAVGAAAAATTQQAHDNQNDDNNENNHDNEIGTDDL